MKTVLVLCLAFASLQPDESLAATGNGSCVRMQHVRLDDTYAVEWGEDEASRHRWKASTAQSEADSIGACEHSKGLTIEAGSCATVYHRFTMYRPIGAPDEASGATLSWGNASNPFGSPNGTATFCTTTLQTNDIVLRSWSFNYFGLQTYDIVSAAPYGSPQAGFYVAVDGEKRVP